MLPTRLQFRLQYASARLSSRRSVLSHFLYYVDQPLIQTSDVYLSQFQTHQVSIRFHSNCDESLSGLFFLS